MMARRQVIIGWLCILRSLELQSNWPSYCYSRPVLPLRYSHKEWEVAYPLPNLEEKQPMISLAYSAYFVLENVSKYKQRSRNAGKSRVSCISSADFLPSIFLILGSKANSYEANFGQTLWHGILHTAFETLPRRLRSSILTRNRHYSKR
jgi:hypothetical protein